MLQRTYRIPRLCPPWSRVVQLQQQQQHRLRPLSSKAESTFRHATDLLSERSHHGRSTCCAATARTTTPLLQSHEFSLQPLQVRPHEVDQYSVVNNAVFVQYLQHGMFHPPSLQTCGRSIEMHAFTTLLKLKRHSTAHVGICMQRDTRGCKQKTSRNGKRFQHTLSRS